MHDHMNVQKKVSLHLSALKVKHRNEPNPRKTGQFLFLVRRIQLLFNITPKMSLSLMGGNFPGVKWMECEANYSSPSSLHTSIFNYITI